MKIVCFDTNAKVLILARLQGFTRVYNHISHVYRTIFIDTGVVKASLKICRMRSRTLRTLHQKNNFEKVILHLSE